MSEELIGHDRQLVGEVRAIRLDMLATIHSGGRSSGLRLRLEAVRSTLEVLGPRSAKCIGGQHADVQRSFVESTTHLRCGVALDCPEGRHHRRRSRGHEGIGHSTGDAETREKLAELELAFKDYQDAVAGILGNMQRLVQAKQAGSSIFRDSVPLLKATTDLSNAYAAEIAVRATNTWVISIFALLAVAMLAMMAKVFNDDSATRREQAERERNEAETSKNASQQAILRLMNEMGDLADGDLTVRATVTEDILSLIHI